MTEFKQGSEPLRSIAPCQRPDIAMMEEINDALKGFQGKKDLKVFSSTPKEMLSAAWMWEHMGDLARK